MASAKPDQIERFKNNIGLFHNSLGTCWNVMVIYLLMYSDQTRDLILDVVLLKELDYTKKIRPYEDLITMKATELVECAFARGMIDMVLPLSKSSPYFPYYKLKKKENVINIVTQFMLRINRKCNEYIMSTEAQLPGPLVLRRSDSVDDEKCIQKHVSEFFDDDSLIGLYRPQLPIYFNLLSAIFINKLYYMQLIKLGIGNKSRNFMESVEENEDYNVSLGYIILVHKHVFCIVKYKNSWKFCDNQYNYDFNMDQFMKDFYTPGIEIFYNLYHGLYKQIPDGTIEHYSLNIPGEIIAQPIRDTSKIEHITRVVKHDEYKLPFRDALYNLLVPKPFIKTDIIYNLVKAPPIYDYIGAGKNKELLELIIKGVNIDIVNNFGNTPVSYAILINNMEAANLLIRYGCDLSYIEKDNPLFLRRTAEIESGRLITDELQQLYDMHELKYEKQEPRKVIKQNHKNLNQNALVSLHKFYQGLIRNPQFKIPQKMFNYSYDYLIETNPIITNVDTFKTYINKQIRDQGIDKVNEQINEFARIQSSQSKYLKYNSSSKRTDILDDISHKKYIKYKHKYLKLKESIYNS